MQQAEIAIGVIPGPDPSPPIRPDTPERPRNREREADSLSFHPTSAMRRFAEACITSESSADDESRCRAAGIALKTLGDWRRRPGFADWLRREIERRLAESAWEGWLAVRRLALAGSLQAAKLFLERFDPAPTRRHDEGMPETFRALAELARLAAENCTETGAC